MEENGNYDSELGEMENLYYAYRLDKKPVPVAKKIAFEILVDLTSRRGLRQTWEGIDREIHEEIITAWISIVEKNLIS